MIRLTSTFIGQVQGVSFRYTTQRIAAAHRVAGYVKNQPDRSVLLVIEATHQDARAFLDEVCETMKRHIRTADTHESPPTGEFGDPASVDSFNIRT